MPTSQNEASPLDSPGSSGRPFFAYGVFKPTELAYGQLKDLVLATQEDVVAGSLLIRDGFAVYDPAGHGRVRGSALWFRTDAAEEAYQRICEFEPQRLYKWVQAPTERGEAVNLVAARGSPIRGAVPHEHDDWSLWRDDAMFRDGTRMVVGEAEQFAHFSFPSAPPDEFPWTEFLQLQMLHMFGWTILERYVAMRFGPRTAPTQAARRLGEDKVFATALLQTAMKLDRPLFDTRGGSPYRFSPEDPAGSARYLYQLRSNVVHRGKGAHQDAELLRVGFLVLSEVLDLIRQSYSPAAA